MARAKHTARSEARRRHRQAHAQSQPETELEDGEASEAALDYGERRPDLQSRRPAAAPKADPNARVGFGAAFRQAYRPAHVREDLAHLPGLFRSRAFLFAVGLVLLGTVVILAFPGYDGSAFAFELLVWPGSAIGPQLVAGFLAPRASYLLGLLVGLLQGVIFVVLLTMLGARLGTNVPPDQLSNLLFLGFVSGPVSGMLFAASAAWYRRFLSLTGPKRAQAGRGAAKTTSKRSARR